MSHHSPNNILKSHVEGNEATYYKKELSAMEIRFNKQWHEMGTLVGENASLRLKLNEKQSQISEVTYLNHCLAEECGEVTQVLGKIGRFGLYDTPNADQENNFIRLRSEMQDIVAVYEMFCSAIGESPELSEKGIHDKKVRVQKYMRYSQEQGILPNE